MINKGIGDLRLQLPEDIGVRVRVEGVPFTQVTALDLTRDGDSYTRGDFFTTVVFVDVIISQTFGTIALECQNHGIFVSSYGSTANVIPLANSSS